MNPIIEYAPSRVPLEIERPAGHCVYWGLATGSSYALLMGIGTWLVDLCWHVSNGLGGMKILVAIGLCVNGAFVGMIYGGVLFIFESRMHRRVRFKALMGLVLPLSLLAGVLVEVADHLRWWHGEWIVLACMFGPMFLGFALSIATARPVVLVPYLVPPVPLPAEALNAESQPAAEGSGGT